MEMKTRKEQSEHSFQDFKKGDKIGEGGFAIVYKGEYRGKSSCFPKFVAIKEILKTNDKWSKHEDYVNREIKIHEDSHHPNIVKLYHCLQDDKKIWMIVELCSGTLDEYLKKRKCLSENEAYEIFKQIVDGVVYLHSKHIVHRDLTLKNILLTYDKQAKIADFGLSAKLPDSDNKLLSRVGTYNYFPPEMKKNEGHNDKVDCWNLGCILYALFVGKIPRLDTINYPENISVEAKALLKKLLEKNPTKRMCIEAVPNSDFFKKYEEYNRSKRNACRSRDSDNGSNCYTKEKESPVRSWDSGFNSKDSEIRKKSHSEKKFFRPGSSNFNKRNGGVSNSYRTPIRERSASEERKPYQLSNYNNASLQNQHRSRDFYKDQERWKNTDSCTNSTCKTYYSFNPEPINPFKDPSCRFDNPMNERNKVCSSICSHVGFCDNKCSHTGTCRCHHSYLKCQLSNCANTENWSQNRPEEIPPLNAVRLKPKRHYIKDRNIAVQISADNLVILESHKIKREKTYVSEVLIISTNGKQIKVYNPPKHSLLADDRLPPFPSDPSVVKTYTYDSLSESYRKKYLIAKKFVDTLRAKTPKLINNGPNAKFYVMENSPDPDCRMDFYDGNCIIEKSKEIKYINKYGKKISESSKRAMLEEFKDEKENCKMIVKLHEGFKNPNFPIVLGMAKSDLYGIEIRCGKENHAPVSSTNSKYNRRDDK